jgi:hypothetical protein
VTLADLYKRLANEARATGEDRATELTGGARLCVRIRDGVTTLSIARHGKPVGATELITFQRLCVVPPEATRWPAEGQHERAVNGKSLWQVVYSWREVIDE